MTQYRYQLERYRGRSTRHVCPQCGRKNVFTRYIDTENNNIYINDNVGKCNRERMGRYDPVGTIIPLTNILLITPGRGRMFVRSFFYIGKKNERTKTKRQHHGEAISLKWVWEKSRTVGVEKD